MMTLSYQHCVAQVHYVHLFDLPMTAEYCGIRCYCACTLEHFLMLPWRPIQKQLVAWQISVRTPGSPSPRSQWLSHATLVTAWYNRQRYGECSACESWLASIAGPRIYYYGRHALCRWCRLHWCVLLVKIFLSTDMTNCPRGLRTWIKHGTWIY